MSESLSLDLKVKSYSKDLLLSLFSAALPKPVSLGEIPGIVLEECAMPINLLPVSAAEDALKQQGPIYFPVRTYPEQHGQHGYQHGYRGRGGHSHHGSYAQTPSEDNGWTQVNHAPRTRGGYAGSHTPHFDDDRRGSRGAHTDARGGRHKSFGRGGFYGNDDVSGNYTPHDAYAGSRFGHLRDDSSNFVVDESNLNANASSPKPDFDQSLDESRKWKGSRLRGRMDEGLEWFYRDPQLASQGPFSKEQMKEWWDGGFFTLNLPVRCYLDAPFIPLGAWFAEGKSAFLDSIPVHLEKEYSVFKSALLGNVAASNNVSASSPTPTWTPFAQSLNASSPGSFNSNVARNNTPFVVDSHLQSNLSNLPQSSILQQSNPLLSLQQQQQLLLSRQGLGNIQFPQMPVPQMSQQQFLMMQQQNQLMQQHMSVLQNTQPANPLNSLQNSSFLNSNPNIAVPSLPISMALQHMQGYMQSGQNVPHNLLNSIAVMQTSQQQLNTEPVATPIQEQSLPSVPVQPAQAVQTQPIMPQAVVAQPVAQQATVPQSIPVVVSPAPKVETKSVVQAESSVSSVEAAKPVASKPAPWVNLKPARTSLAEIQQKEALEAEQQRLENLKIQQQEEVKPQVWKPVSSADVAVTSTVSLPVEIAPVLVSTTDFPALGNRDAKTKKSVAAGAIEAAKRKQDEQSPIIPVQSSVTQKTGKSKAVEKVEPSAWNSGVAKPKTLREIQEEELINAKIAEAEAPKVVVVEKTSAWGAAPVSQKSDLRSIQEQEAKSTANVNVSQGKTIAQLVSGRAATTAPVVSASNTIPIKSIREISAEQAATSTAAPLKSYSSTMGGSKIVPSGEVSKPAAVSPVTTGVAVVDSGSDDMFWNAKPVEPVKAVSVADVAATSGVNAKGLNKNAFGGPALSRDMESWCKQEMAKLTGNDDTTLVSFLMTLDSATQIREYCHAYLGSSAAVEKFCESFITQREFSLGRVQKLVGSSTGAVVAPTVVQSKKKKGNKAKEMDD